MSKLVKKILLAIFFWGIFAYAVFAIPYPESLTTANPLQIIFFFIPLLLALTFTLNIFLKNFSISSSISLGLILLLLLKALDSLSIVTGAFIVIAVALLISYFKKIRKRSLTKLPKIPKLTRLRKQ